MKKRQKSITARSALASALVLSSLLTAVPLTAAKAEQDEFNGENMCIAVLDNGFFTSHECFTLTTDKVKLTKEGSDALIKSTAAGKSEIIPETLYISDKIPFAYDYGDNDPDVYSEKTASHGTAMISIAAGNPANTKLENPAAKGIAPEAQILAMKVYSDNTDSITDTALVNAIEDSIVLGADAILLPLANICGIETEPEGEHLAAAIKKATDAGIAVICPVGNVFEYGNESFFELEYDSDPLPTSSVDIGTVAWPGTLSDVITVASAVDNERTAYVLETPSDFIPYSDSNYLYPNLTDGKLFSSFFYGQDLEYVFIDGIGTPEEFAAGDFNGKIAIVNRGTISFSEKTVNAAAAGAIGVIAVDNQPYEQVTFDTKADLSEAVLPLILVPMNCKNVFILETEKSLTVKMGETYTVTTRDTPYPSAFSASGTTPELSLKPDITAIGSEVGCASADGGYAKISSTSAAAAKIAGMYACTKEKLLQKQDLTDPVSVYETAKAMIISSARLMARTSTNVPYSPRLQGAGSADLEASLNSDLLLLSNGSSKIELGELSSRFVSFSATAVNLSDTEKQCTLDAIVGSDGYKTYTIADIDDENADIPLSERLGLNEDDELSFITSYKELPKAAVRIGDGLYSLNRSAADYAPFTFTLAPGASLTFKVSIILDPEEYNTYKRIFENGFFVEGFLRLSDDDSEASIPFLGFMGDFSKAPALDAELYGGGVPLFEGVYLYRNSIKNSSVNILGEDTSASGENELIYDKSKLFFNPKDSTLSSTLMINLGLLRTVTDVNITVSDSSGKIIKHTDYGTLARTYHSSTTGMLESPRLPIFSFRAEDNYKYIYPDGTYTVTVSYRKPSSDTAESLTYEIHLDTTAPTITKHSFTKTEYKCLLDIEATDNIALQSIFVIDSNDDEARLNEDGKYDTSLLTGQYIYVDVFDCAGNNTTIRLDNPVYISDDE